MTGQSIAIHRNFARYQECQDNQLLFAISCLAAARGGACSWQFFLDNIKNAIAPDGSKQLFLGGEGAVCCVL